MNFSLEPSKSVSSVTLGSFLLLSSTERVTEALAILQWRVGRECQVLEQNG